MESNEFGHRLKFSKPSKKASSLILKIPSALVLQLQISHELHECVPIIIDEKIHFKLVPKLEPRVALI